MNDDKFNKDLFGHEIIGSDTLRTPEETREPEICLYVGGVFEALDGGFEAFMPDIEHPRWLGDSPDYAMEKASEQFSTYVGGLLEELSGFEVPRASTIKDVLAGFEKKPYLVFGIEFDPVRLEEHCKGELIISDPEHDPSECEECANIGGDILDKAQRNAYLIGNSLFRIDEYSGQDAVCLAEEVMHNFRSQSSPEEYRRWSRVWEYLMITHSKCPGAPLMVVEDDRYDSVREEYRNYKMIRNYTAMIRKDEGTAYWVDMPDVPGCASTGESKVEALKNFIDAIEFHIEGMKEEGEILPHARARDEVLAAEQDPYIDSCIINVDPETGKVLRIE